MDTALTKAKAGYTLKQKSLHYEAVRSGLSRDPRLQADPRHVSLVEALPVRAAQRAARRGVRARETDRYQRALQVARCVNDSGLRSQQSTKLNFKQQGV